MKNPKFSYIIRAICGVYLLWIVWDFANAFLKGENLSLLMIIAAIAFAFFGIVFVITGIRGWMRVNKEQKEEAENPSKEQEQPKKEEPSGAGHGMSLSERANLVKSLGKVEETEDKKEEEG